MKAIDFGLIGGGGIAGGLVLAGAFNLVQGAIQLIGVGTALSILISISSTVIRFRYEQDEDRRKQTTETILRLQPNVYGPLIRWAVTTKRQLDADPKEEFHHTLTTPPDLSIEPNYRSLVGPTLKTDVETVRKSSFDYSESRIAVYREYNDRLSSLVKELMDPEWLSMSLALVLRSREGSEQVFSFERFATDYGGLKSAREIVDKSQSIFVRYGNDPRGLVECPPKLLKAVLEFNDLPSYAEFQAGREELQAQLSPFISELDEIGVKGEGDWRLMQR